MIVCSLPRCGATRICLDLEKKTRLKFIGELHPMYLVENKKAEVHETGYQPSFSSEEFSEYLHNSRNYIVLINQACFYMLPFCDTLILRKNMLDSFLSGANFLLKMYPYIKANIIIQEVQNTIVEYVGVKSYIDRFNVPIIWYEEYFNLEGTSTPILDSHLHGEKIKMEVTKAYYKLLGEK